MKVGLILHSNQGFQHTSHAFTDFCTTVGVTQSMSKAGYPYDNAPMERYFNTLENECTDLFEFLSEELLYISVEEFAYVTTISSLTPATFTSPPGRLAQLNKHPWCYTHLPYRFLLAILITILPDYYKRSIFRFTIQI